MSTFTVPAQRARSKRIAPVEMLLVLGVAAPLLYVLTDVVAAAGWEGYSFRDQTISELNAIGSPVRTLTIVLGLVGYALLVGFGVGVRRSATRERRLRVVGGALVVFAVMGLWAVPFASMHVRGAERTLTDTLHLVGLPIAVSLLLLMMGFAAAELGPRFRIYTLATILVMLAFGAWSGMDGGRIADDLATPWLGVKERVSVYSYQLWLIVLAVVLLRRRLAAKRPSAG